MGEVAPAASLPNLISQTPISPSPNPSSQQPDLGMGSLRSSNLSVMKTHISYKAKFMGADRQGYHPKTFKDQMNEWIGEEAELAPILSEKDLTVVSSLSKLDISDDRLQELCWSWNDSLLITLLGKHTNLRMMKDRLAWLLKSDHFELIDLSNNFYIFRPKDLQLTARLLFDGPWVIQGHYLAVQSWSPNFSPYCNKMKKVAIWIRIPLLPVHMYSEECLMEIGNLVGKALKVNINILAHINSNTMVERGKFAEFAWKLILLRSYNHALCSGKEFILLNMKVWISYGFHVVVMAIRQRIVKCQHRILQTKKFRQQWRRRRWRWINVNMC